MGVFFLAACGNNDRGTLGKVWHENEGPWNGTWTRRGDGNTFDAVWKNANGHEIRDEITVESLSDNKIVLYRKGTNGRYHGRLSADGTKVENGTADWFSQGASWSAQIEK